MRLRNAFENGDETPAGARLKDVHAKETLRKAAAVMNERPKPAGENIGRGLAAAHWLVGGMASSAGVKLNEDGTIGILTGVVDLSGASTSLAQIVAEVLGVSLDDVHVRTADTDFAPHSHHQRRQPGPQEHGQRGVAGGPGSAAADPASGSGQA